MLVVLGTVFVSRLSKVVLSEDEITTQGLFGAKTLRWTEISRVSGRGNGIKLHNFDEDVTVAPDQQLPRYEEIIETIGKKRPDLFSPLDHSEMKRGLGSYSGVLISALFLVGVAAAFFFGGDLSSDAPVAFIVIAGIILIFLWMFLASPQSLTLDGRTLQLKYLLNEKTLSAEEIASVQFVYTRTRNGKQYYIALNLAGGGTIRISGLGVSLPVTYLVLKNWHRANAQGSSANLH